MVILVVALTILFLGISSKAKDRSMVLFNLIWLASVSVNLISIPTVWKPSEYTYVLILLFVLFTNIGFLVGRNITFTKTNGIYYRYILNRRLFYIVNLVFIIVFIFGYTLRSISITKQYGVFYTRYYAFVGAEQFFGSTMKLLFAQIVIYSVFFGSLIVGVYDFFNREDKRRRISIPLVVGLFEMVLYSFTFKGRQPIFLALFFMLIGYLAYYKWTKKEYTSFSEMNVKNKVRIVVIALLIAVVVLSISRFNGLSHIRKFLITYFGSQPTYLSELINKSEVQYTPTRFTLCGLLDTIKLTINQIFNTNLVIGSNEIGKLIDGNTLIGPDITMNAGCTAIFYFYYELGIIGVVLYSFIFGFISIIAYKDSFRKRTVLGHTMLLLSFYTIYYTYSGWSLKYFYFWAAPFVVKLFYKKSAEN